MKLVRVACLAAPVLALALTHARDASACGGCFVQQSESTQVTGHRMILSVSPKSTTLWDQITYSGNPASFAWVLPTKGVVEVGLSSDALFSTLEPLTEVIVSSPQISCPPPPQCNVGAFDAAEGSGGPGGAAGEPPVEVIAQEVVGPYETVQLKSEDPEALQKWLASHGYEIPDDIKPVLSAYVKEGFNFLALKLVPGQGIDAMRPVRITTPGASPVLPLRMVAAGTGAVTPITLWILGEGRYEPTNFDTFLIGEDDIVWNWDSQSSNYNELKQAGFAASQGMAWLVEAAEPVSAYSIQYPLEDLVNYSPENSGYGGANGDNAQTELTADLEKLYGGISPNALAITRLHGQLSRLALATDLEVGASADQSIVPRYFEAKKTIGTPPPCPPQPPCGDGDGPGPGSGSSGGIFEDLFGDGDDLGKKGGDATAGGGCATGTGGTAGKAAFGLAAVFALAARLRRRRAR